MKPGYTYIMTNKRHTVLYTGCTSDIVRRVKEHKQHKYTGSFTDKYNCEKFVYYEELPGYISAINRENRIKNMRRAEKIALINSANPEWNELVAENGASSTSVGSSASPADCCRPTSASTAPVYRKASL